MFSWADIPEITNQRRCHSEIFSRMRSDNYGFERNNWNLTGIVKTTDTRKAMALMILDGLLPNGEKHDSIQIVGDDGNPMLYKLHVLSRYACLYDKNGNRIFKTESGMERSGEGDDIIISPKDKPVEGDKIQFKLGYRIQNDDGLEVTDLELQSMADDGRAVYDMRTFTVDKNECITVPNPFALMALRRNGKKMVYPEFSVQYRPRKITNWWYEEVPRSFTIKKRRVQDKEKTNEQTEMQT